MKPPETNEDGELEVAVLFADLVGYTALTEAHGDHLAARTGTRLLELGHVAYDASAILVKGLGDGVLVVFSHVDDAVRGALALAHAVEREPGFPALRSGIDAGRAVSRGGDVFGQTVNIAARVSAEAAPGQVLITRRAADKLNASRPETVSLGPVALRHVREPVELLVIRASQTSHEDTDPVCRMQVPATDDIVVRVHGGQTWRFCADSCARLFMQDPVAYGASS